VRQEDRRGGRGGEAEASGRWSALRGKLSPRTGDDSARELTFSRSRSTERESGNDQQTTD
jgi:hypothetical protein